MFYLKGFLYSPSNIPNSCTYYMTGSIEGMQMKKKKLKFKNLFMVIFIIYAVITVINQQFSISELKGAEQAAVSKIESVRKDNDKLTEMINNATSIEYIEKMAREQLGLVKAGERVYIDQSSADNNMQNRDN